MALISATRRSTEPHLNQTFDSAKLFKEEGRMERGMNFPARQGLMVLETRSWIISPFTFSLWVDPACLVVSAYTISEGCSS